MARVYVPSRGTKDWKRIYSNPGRQWQKGYPGRALAHCWERADGFPIEVLTLFSSSGVASFQRLEPLLSFLDYDIVVPGGTSRHDLFALARDGSGQLVSIAVLGKVLAPFGPSVGEWLNGNGEKNDDRVDQQVELEFVRDQLEWTEPLPETAPYTLLHHAALAVTSAQRFAAPTAVLIIHAFGQKANWIGEYDEFLHLFHAHRTLSALHLLKHTKGVSLYCGWATGDKKYLRK
ncbi:MAG: hypothetical protein Kow0074_04900 [Candidatus Zixiibacteriota bacterium]